MPAVAGHALRLGPFFQHFLGGGQDGKDWGSHARPWVSRSVGLRWALLDQKVRKNKYYAKEWLGELGWVRCMSCAAADPAPSGTQPRSGDAEAVVRAALAGVPYGHWTGNP